ncbi:hypothetical protein [Hyphococcus luteus]|nr:hypothetical protein [Marinicaulis flavus]
MAAAQRKRTRLLIFFLLLAALLFATGALFAQITTKSGEQIDAGDVSTDMVFLAAGELSISAKSSDDIFAAGGDISINGAQADHMIVAGGDITVTKAGFHDFIVAGGDVDLIDATITDDLVAAAGDLNVRTDFRVDGSAVLSGGDISIDAPIGGELRAAGASVRLNSEVGQDAHIVGEEIFIGPNARIGGDLRHRSGKIHIDPAAVVSGQIIELESPARPDLEAWGVKAAAAAAAFALAFLIGVALLIIVIALALPALMNSASDTIREKPFSMLGIGFLISVAAPIVVIFLFATIFGIPLALLIAVLYAAAWPLAIAAFAYFLGMQARRAMNKNAAPPGAPARAIWSALAAITLALVSLIPILGGLVWIIAFVIGLGAVMTRGGKALALKA